MRAVLFVVMALGACFSKPPFSVSGGENEPTRLATGGNHTCRIDDASQLYCWGLHTSGQLGEPRPAREDAGVSTPTLAFDDEHRAGWTAVAAGKAHTCGIRAGEVACWGDNRYQQTHPGSDEERVTYHRVSVPGTPQKIFAGEKLSCAINTDGHAYCWGVLDFAESSAEPIRLTMDRRFHAIAIGADHACAIEAVDNTEGPVWCWGQNSFQQLGHEDASATFAAPTKIASEARFRSIAAAMNTTCGTTQDARLLCWGSREGGLLGSGGSAELFNVIDIDQQRWTRVTMGTEHVCALSDENKLFCYGDNTHGALGSGHYTTDSASTPKPIAIGEHTYLEIAAGDDHTCALTRPSPEGPTETWCWGSNSFGELGKGKSARTYVPREIALPGDVEEIIAADDHTCARTTRWNGDTETYCWGLNTRGQVLPGGPSPSVGTPVMVSANAHVQLAAGRQHTCGRLTDGTIECWGNDDLGQLGTAADLHRVWTYLAAGGDTTCGIVDEQLHCWGQLVTRHTAQPTPIASPQMVKWQKVTVGTNAVLAAVESEEGWQLYGFGNRCALGDGDNSGAVPENDVIPLDLDIDADAEPLMMAAQAGGGHSCVLGSRFGSVMTCFGANNHGQLGSSEASCAAIVEPPDGEAFANPANNVLMVTADQSCALLPSRELLCWGKNDAGELGPISEDPVQPPSVVHGGMRWDSLAGGRVHMCGISGNVVHCWGENQFGALGDGSHFEPSPIRVLE
jgi:alpha-tubulin suppressor-like RCC1 family protein